MSTENTIPNSAPFLGPRIPDEEIASRYAGMSARSDTRRLTIGIRDAKLGRVAEITVEIKPSMLALLAQFAAAALAAGPELQTADERKVPA